MKRLPSYTQRRQVKMEARRRLFLLHISTSNTHSDTTVSMNRRAH